MSTKSKTSGKALAIALEGELTIFRVNEFKKAILPMISQHQAIDLDLSNVTEIDAAGLQFLMSAKLEAWRQDRVMHFNGHSAVVTNAIDLCGLSGFFGDPMVISSMAA